jgi:hypothetical protein
MRRRIFTAVLVLVSLSIAPVHAGEVVLNYEFTDGMSSVADGYLLSSPGGTYWNRVGSSSFSGPSVYDSTTVRDQFGNSIYRDSDPMFGLGVQRIPVPGDYFNPSGSGDVQVTGSPTTAPLGSLRFAPLMGDGSGGLHLVQLIGTFLDARYDIAVYFKGVDSSGTFALPGSIKLTRFGMPEVAASPVVTPSLPNGYFAALFTDVQPERMHIGFPQVDPVGFGISFYPTFTGNVAVQIAGIQIRGVIPEPSAWSTGCLALLGLVARTRRCSRLPSSSRPLRAFGSGSV